MPVEPVPAAAIAAPVPHARKLAFLLGALVTWGGILLIQRLLGLK